MNPTIKGVSHTETQQKHASYTALQLRQSYLPPALVLKHCTNYACLGTFTRREASFHTRSVHRSGLARLTRLLMARGAGQNDKTPKTFLRGEKSTFSFGLRRSQDRVENLEVSLRSEKLLELDADWLISLPIFSTCWSSLDLHPF